MAFGFGDFFTFDFENENLEMFQEEIIGSYPLELTFRII